MFTVAPSSRARTARKMRCTFVMKGLAGDGKENLPLDRPPSKRVLGASCLARALGLRTSPGTGHGP